MVNDDSLFPSRVRESPRLGTRQYARILNSSIEEIGLDPTVYGTHTIRRTKNIRAVQLLLRYTKLASTVRYLGIEVEDALEISDRLKFGLHRIGNWQSSDHGPIAVFKIERMVAVAAKQCW